MYYNIISIIYAIQEHCDIKTNETLLQYYKTLYTIYNIITSADIINNKIFIDKQWDLLDYFDLFSVSMPIKILYNFNTKPYVKNPISKKKYIIVKKKQQNILSNANTTKSISENSKSIDIECCNNIYVKNFNLSHHTQYNYMRQEQAIHKKKINNDYMTTYENNINNIYYNLKRFQFLKQNNKPIINKTYLKILDKIDSLHILS